MDRTWVRKGTNQKEGPYMGENVPPSTPINIKWIKNMKLSLKTRDLNNGAPGMFLFYLC